MQVLFLGLPAGARGLYATVVQSSQEGLEGDPRPILLRHPPSEGAPGVSWTLVLSSLGSPALPLQCASPTTGT